MSEPTIQIDHQATLQPSPVQPQGAPLATNPAPTTASVSQYQPPISTGPENYQEPTQFTQNPSPTNSSTSPSQAPAQSEPPAQTTANTPNQSTQPDYFPGVAKPLPEEIVLEWNAPSRPHKQRQKQYFTTIAIFVFLIALILFFLSQFLLIGVVLAVAFLVYVLEVVPPTMVRNQITTYGIRVENNLYYWDELGRFWFTQKYGQTLLHIEVARFPGRLTLLLGDLTEKDLTDLLSEVLLHQRPEPTAFEKASERLQQLIPLESDKPTTAPNQPPT